MATTNLPQSIVSHVPVPLIDIQGLNGPNHSDIVKEIGQACEHGGFFQVKNHGIPETVINNMMLISKEFSGLPESESLKTESALSWRDFLRINCYPLEDYVNEWPSDPPSFREDVAAYCTNLRGLILRLLEAISESLGLEKDYIDRAIKIPSQNMAINFYPPCPKPELTFGIGVHTDPNLVTLLLQDDVPGLQFLSDGKWVTVEPFPNTIVVTMCDQIQVLSNDRYKSAIHRAAVSSERKRISVPTFYCPSKDAVMGPVQQLIDDDHPAVYRNFKYGEYFEKYKKATSATGTTLDMFKATATF